MSLELGWCLVGRLQLTPDPGSWAGAAFPEERQIRAVPPIDSVLRLAENAVSRVLVGRSPRQGRVDVRSEPAAAAAVCV